MDFVFFIIRGPINNARIFEPKQSEILEIEPVAPVV